MNIRTTILLITFLGGFLFCRAQEQASPEPQPLPSGNGTFTVSASLDDDSIVVGSHTLVHLRVDGVGNTALFFPTPDQLSRGAVEFLEARYDTLRNKQEGITSIIAHLEITSFEAGRHAIAGLCVGADKQLYAPADSLFVVVSYAADADTNKCEAREDMPYEREPYTFFEIARRPLLALVAAAIVYAIVWVVRRRRQHQPIVPVPKAKQIPADRRALNELESLRRKELWQKGRIKKYYTDLTDIVRRFLRNMYGINASEMTSRQTLRAFHQSADWNEASEQLLRQLLQSADMVKFAKRQPESFEHDQAMQTAIDFVRAVSSQHALNNTDKEEDKK